MWNIILFGAIGVATIVFQTALLQILPLWCGRPDFLFILLLFIVWRFPWIPGFFLVFVLSWMMDVEVGVSLGFYPLINLLVFTLLKWVAVGGGIRETAWQIPVLGIAWISGQFVLHMIDIFTGRQMLPDWELTRTLQQGVLLMIIAIPLFSFYNSLYIFVEERGIKARAGRSAKRSRRRM